MKQGIKSPKKKGVASVPVIMQMENMECGSACLAMILAYYGKWIPLSKLRERCGISRDGVKMSTIAKTARSLGLKAQGYRYEPEEFFKNATFPCVVHWRFKHFIVIKGWRGRYVYINDPAGGALKITMEEFDECFTGVCVCFEPDEGFTPSGSQRSILSYIGSTLKNSKQAFVFVAVATVVTTLSAAIVPAVSRVFVDRILSDRSPEWLLPILILLGVLCGVQIVVGCVQSVYQMKLFGMLGVRGGSRYMWHLFHMPARFFFQRHPGDLQQNEEATRMIAETFIMRVVPILINTVMMVYYIVVMFRYSWILSAIGLTFVFINLLLSRYIANRRINIMRVIKRDMARMMSTSMAGVSMLETIKASGAENNFFGRWSGYQANMSNQLMKYEKVSQVLGSIPGTLIRISSVLILCLGVYFIFRGYFTVGMVMAFQSYLTAFMAPAQQVIDSGQMIQEMRTDMERIEDIMEYPEQKTFAEDDVTGEFRKLKGSIEIDHVTFGYNESAEPLIRDFSLKVEPGSSVAVVGSSGCGKSTILSLISGLYQPWEGTVTFDGRRMEEIPKSVFRGSVAVIDQKIILFHDTIANNIRMWDRSIEDFEIVLAARDAQIHDEILKRKNGYEHVLSEGGSDFSGGERQRLEIARALATDPSVIIMDEATSALDAATENRVVKAVKDRGITCFIVAHRLSTIRDCDKIIVLDRGRVVETGDHEELMKLKGMYHSLVSNN